MRSRRFALLVAVVCEIALSAGCGSSDSTPAPVLPGQAQNSGSETLDKAFWRRAGAECDPFIQWTKRHPRRQLRSFDPANPTPSGLRRYAAVSQRIPLYRPDALTDVVRRLGRPRTGVSDWKEVAGAMRHLDAITKRVLSDAKSADIPSWKREFQAQIDAYHQISADLYGIGLPSSNACVKLFG